jgi:hypothetical protein
LPDTAYHVYTLGLEHIKEAEDITGIVLPVPVKGGDEFAKGHLKSRL